jgi:cell division protein FtsI (penicillin-binding protein 3)
MYNRLPDMPPVKKRFVIFAVLFSAAALGVLGRYIFLMSGAQAPDTPEKSLVIAERGPILDRNGRILAIQTRMGNLSVRRPEIRDINALTKELAVILETSQASLLELIENSPRDFIYLARRADQSVLRAVEEAKARGQLAEVGIEPLLGRIYPQKNLAAQLIGFVNERNEGKAGVEYSFDSYLAPKNGVPGSQLILTIDARVQFILEEISRRVMEENKAEAVMFMAMDPRTGDILGSVSEPGFDLNAYGESDEMERMDRPAVWSYEPGSVFKVFSIAALLDRGAIGRQDYFFCNGRYERVTRRGENIVIRCMGNHGRVNSRDIIVHSCNAGAAYASDFAQAGDFYEGLKAMGFGAKTGAGNPGETVGGFKTPDKWSDRSKATISFGQEIAVSALQVVQAASAIANDGVLSPARVVSRIVSSDGQRSEAYAGGGARRVIKPETARTMLSYMAEGTTSEGIGRRANVEDISLAVKTGTAQFIDPDTLTYSETDYIASCLALLPAENPALILYLVIVKPQGESYFGANIAAPAIREAAESLANYLGIPRGRNPHVTWTGRPTVQVGADGVIGKVMPDLRGYSKRQLVPLLLRDDITVEIRGDGYVYRQSPAPGTAVAPGDQVILELQ